MKTTLGLTLVLIIGITSCNGRKNSNLALAQSIEEFKTKNAIESVSYLPKNYREQSQDTTLSNGFKIKTRTFTNMNDSVVKSVIRDTITYKKLHREVNALVTIFFNDKQVFEKTITKDFLTHNLISEQLNLEHSVLQSLWLSQDHVLQDNEVTLYMDYCDLTNESCKRFSISIDNLGNYIIKSISNQTYL
jgi:hypothetical protein